MADYRKAATSVLDFTFDWSTYLGGVDTIVSSAWSVPSGITGTNQSSTATSTSIRISGGTLGKFYGLVNTITMASGQIDQRPLIITIGS